MNYNLKELNDKGWAHIHEAAYRGYVKSIDKFVRSEPTQLEFETGDSLHLTPILVATLGGHLEAVRCLVELGAQLDAIDTRGHGVVELAALGQNVEILSYLVRLPDQDLRVWRKLLKLLSAESQQHTDAVTCCLRELLDPAEPFADESYKRRIYDRGYVPVLVRILDSTTSETTREGLLKIFLFIYLPSSTATGNGAKMKEQELDLPEQVKDQAFDSGIIPVLVRLIGGGSSSDHQTIQMSAKILADMCSAKKYADDAYDRGAVPAAVGVLMRSVESSSAEMNVTLIEVVEALGAIIGGNCVYQSSVGDTPGAVRALVLLFRDATDRTLLLSLTSVVVKIIRGHVDNQLRFVNDGLAVHLIALLCGKIKPLQEAAIEVVHRLAENNPQVQKKLKADGIVAPLLETLTKLRHPMIQETLARALWAIAGDDFDELSQMFEKIGVQQLIDFLGSPSDDLQFIGSEGIGILSRFCVDGPSDLRQANAVHPLVKLLGSPQEKTVLSAVRTLRFLSVKTAYLPQPIAQTVIGQARGLKLLVALMVHAKNSFIQVESAFTISCAALGNQDNAEDLRQNLDFSLVRVINMLYSKDEELRSIAGSSLATFAFNNATNQKAIVKDGGVRFSCFLPLLRSSNEFYRCNAAFQIVVLADILPDVEPAISSAAGIRLIVDLLEKTKNDFIRSLSADCVARLSHTRAGIPAAFISIDAVNYLTDMLMSPVDHVKRNAVIALGYLSYYYEAKRKILIKCRKNQKMMKVIRKFAKNNKISSELLKDWKHYQHIGLPSLGLE